MENKLKVWMETYTKNLVAAVEDHPTEYSYSVGEVPAVASRMKVAFTRGSYNKDGRAIHNTCLDLGIKHTYKAISAYLQGPSCETS